MVEYVLWCIGHELLIENVTASQGCYVYDHRGRKYMDLESEIWVTPFGHSHPRTIRVVWDQLDRVVHTGCCYSPGIVEEASRAFLEICGLEHGKCVFLSPGSETVEFGIQTLHKISGKRKLLCLQDSFLGTYGSAGKKNPEEWFLLDWNECQACRAAEQCGTGCHPIANIPFQVLGALSLSREVLRGWSGFLRPPSPTTL